MGMQETYSVDSTNFLGFYSLRNRLTHPQHIFKGRKTVIVSYYSHNIVNFFNNYSFLNKKKKTYYRENVSDEENVE